ncbi:hypothetical protein [Ramlibacter alkalitolerans]|uniref:Uncharacterized protein n=1 Tax=Ramlibacter alkalitolerans TaxID=2039631 RepID=A0ABS1JU28_9BURK|nr:hypothetical protein [Ramlibacter alkalitolerans]MBL0427739.1 hypothetical protein [Ramlibacter alkalitolerans]
MNTPAKPTKASRWADVAGELVFGLDMLITTGCGAALLVGLAMVTGVFGADAAVEGKALVARLLGSWMTGSYAVSGVLALVLIAGLWCWSAARKRRKALRAKTAT